MAALRSARPEDYPAFVRLFPELAVDDPVPDRGRWTREMAPGTVIAEDGDVVGYAWFQALEGSGYVRQVVVAPDARGIGLGRQLLEDVASRLRADGATAWRLNVKPDNVPAIRLYERLGMRRQYASSAIRLPWTAVDALPLRPADARIVTPSEDAGYEAAFSLPAGQLADFRSSGSRVLLGLEDGGRVGFAAFSPEFPGAFPFRVVDPAYARAMYEAMRPHALARYDHVQVVVEDDPALRAALLSVGGDVRLDFLHYAGPLP